MIYDYYASEAAQVAGQTDEELLKSKDPHLIYHYQAVNDRSKEGSGGRKNAGELRAKWVQMVLQERDHQTRWSGGDQIKIPVCDLVLLPRYSFFLQFSFVLARPYISRGEQEFYIIDNPILRMHPRPPPCGGILVEG